MLSSLYDWEAAASAFRKGLALDPGNHELVLACSMTHDTSWPALSALPGTRTLAAWQPQAAECLLGGVEPMQPLRRAGQVAGRACLAHSCCRHVQMRGCHGVALMSAPAALQVAKLKAANAEAACEAGCQAVQLSLQHRSLVFQLRQVCSRLAFRG